VGYRDGQNKFSAAVVLTMSLEICGAWRAYGAYPALVIRSRQVFVIQWETVTSLPIA